MKTNLEVNLIPANPRSRLKLLVSSYPGIEDLFNENSKRLKHKSGEGYVGEDRWLIDDHSLIDLDGDNSRFLIIDQRRIEGELVYQRLEEVKGSELAEKKYGEMYLNKACAYKHTTPEWVNFSVDKWDLDDIYKSVTNEKGQTILKSKP